MNGHNHDEEVIKSDDSNHPANLICELCKLFYDQNWVTGTGGGMSIRDGDDVYLAPSGVQKEVCDYAFQSKQVLMIAFL
jgi:methylthioribulose-1-phosphate dehydratase